MDASTPAGTRRSQVALFMRALAQDTGRTFGTHDELHEFSIRDWRSFWLAFATWCDDLELAGSMHPVCEGDAIEHAVFFPNLRLNYAASLLNSRIAPDDAPALTQVHADGMPELWTRGELRARVRQLAAHLAAMHIGPGDRVAAVLRNDGAAVTAALACAAVGATFSSVAPDMSVQAMLDRFGPLAPTLLFAHAAPRAFDTGMPLAQRVARVADALPSLRAVICVDGEIPAMAEPRRALSMDALLATHAPSRPWPALPFNHPLFIMFSSGTTGRPKCIVHGAGGTLLEHAKEHRLHTDLRPGDRMYFHTSCAWMMWNWQLSALASGVEIVTYDGPVSSADVLWRLVAERHVTVFGTSPAYLRFSQEADLRPARDLDLSSLRAVLSTGAILHDAQFDWVAERVGPLPLQSISGGTDIIGCFVLGHPDRAVTRGKAQCRSLAMDVQAWDHAHHAVAHGIGELVCRTPFPSRPLGFFGDGDGSRFHGAYFARNPGLWTHGDLIEFDDAGGARLHGRCDGVLNVRGVKFAPAEVLRIIEALPGVRAGMLVPQGSDEAQQIVALLVLTGPGTVSATLAAQVRREVTAALSTIHVPDVIVAVPELPITFSGKLSEAAARDAVNGRPASNVEALRNPASLDAIRVAMDAHARGGLQVAPGTLQEQLQALWAHHLGVPDAGPDDSFFELGGHSLAAVRLLRDVERITGRRLALAALVHAPTPRAFAAAVDSREATRAQTAVRMRGGEGRPLFLVHGLSGTVFETWPLVQHMQTRRPVYGLQARGVDGEAEPQASVEEMAQSYVDAIRDVQPRGPYAISGFSFGGLVAFEMARILRERGEMVDLLCLLDPHVHRDLRWHERMREHARRTAREVRQIGIAHAPALAWRKLCSVTFRAGVRLGLRKPRRASDGLGLEPAQQHVYDCMLDALAAYRPQPYDGGRVVLIRASLPLAGYFDALPVWRAMARAGLDVVPVRDGHLDLVGRNAATVARVLDGLLAGWRLRPVAPGTSAYLRTPYAH